MAIRGFSSSSFSPAAKTAAFQPAPAVASKSGPSQPAAQQQHFTDSFAPAAAAPRLALIAYQPGGDVLQSTPPTPTPVQQVNAAGGTGTRPQINSYADLVTALQAGTLRNADIRIPLELSLLSQFRYPGEQYGNETYPEFVQRMRAANPNLSADTEAALDAIEANPNVNWNGLFAQQDLSGATFHEPVTYVNFGDITGTGMTFKGPVTDGWFGASDLEGITFESDVTGSNFTGANMPGVRFLGELEGNALNGAYLAGTDFTTVRGWSHNDFAFARLDGATFSPGTDWGGSVFTGAVTQGAQNAPVSEPLIPSLQFDPAVVTALGGEARIRYLAGRGELLPEVVKLGEPYASALTGALLPESWRSYVADGLNDGGAIKRHVWDTVDSRYGSFDRATEWPSLAYLHSQPYDPRAATLIDNKLAELILEGGRLDDPTRLEGSATGLSYDAWKNQMLTGETVWTTHTSPPTEDRGLAGHPIPRETLYELYAQLEHTHPDEAHRLRTVLDGDSSFTLGELFSEEAAYPNAARLLYAMYGGTGP